MAHAMSLKTLELITPRAALTPCILDDDPSQLELMTELVASAGFEAVATTDPEEALQLLRSGRSRLRRTSLYRYLKEDGYDQGLIARAKAALDAILRK
jgi:CheY-like chemotaxis protein